jgi:hypothetical protein
MIDSRVRRKLLSIYARVKIDRFSCCLRGSVVILIDPTGL